MLCRDVSSFADLAELFFLVAYAAGDGFEGGP